ncbi:MAG: protein kinase [Acidobacteriota bacterium]|nr:protein kinase [Acidobacteriota bacterium]
MSEIAIRGAERPPGYFERLRELFDRIAEMPAEERDAEIVRSTKGDPTLAEELRALLEHAERSETTLDNATLLVAGWAEPPLPVIPGFCVHRRIGRGGSATVYLADQERADFTRPVALKVVDYVVDSTALWRVREEQRILARLEHAGIARLYDTGVTSFGQPYLAMEHVEGESIVEHCRSRQLPIRARIELFLSVLDAVGYAHEHAIVHRDLKPANILVSARGEAKLLDFGIAKLAGDDDATLTLQRAMTPAYASPEQMRGGRITPASDIYSLGVVLYELLANTIPFRLDERSLGKMEAIPERDTEPPSAAFTGNLAMSRSDAAQWRKTLRGDLDAVVLKALRQKPEARYVSAAAFADDLRRVLDGRPVAVRRGDRIYRTVKFFRRHRVAVAVAVVAMLLVTGWQLSNRWRAVISGPPRELAVFYEADGRWLSDGAQNLERFEAAAARDSFRRAAASSRGQNPGEALAWDGVARAENALGEVGRAADAARRASGLIASGATSLSRDEVERIRAAALAANHDWPKAIPAFEELFARQPERVDVGMALASALLASGRTEAADTVLGRLRQLGSESDGDPRIDLLEAQIAHQFSEYQRAAAAATRVRDHAQKLGAIALGLRAERIHAEAIGRLDRREEARRALESLAKRDDAAGLSREAAAARLELASVMSRTASGKETQEVLETALAGLRAAGDARGEIMARALLAVQAGKRGEFAEAIPSVDAALAGARRIGDRWAEGSVLAYRLAILNWADDVAAVDAAIEPALKALRDSGNRQTLMSTLGNFAIVAIENVDLNRAEAYLAEAEALGPRVGSQLASASVDRARGYLEETRGNLDLARERYTSALEKARRAGVSLTVGRYLADLAWVELAAKRPDATEARAREAMAVLETAGDPRSARGIEALLAWTDACRGDAASARKRLEIRRKAVAEDGSDSARFSLLGIEARVAVALGDWPRAVELRRETVRMAAEWKTQGLLIQQQANLAEALHGAGDRRALEKLIAEMLPDVKRLGLHGIERDLRALLAS